MLPLKREAEERIRNTSLVTHLDFKLMLSDTQIRILGPPELIFKLLLP